MFANDVFVGRPINAVDLVVGDVALHPLDFRPELTKHTTAGLRCALEFILPE
jgi:hypothetical protein